MHVISFTELGKYGVYSATHILVYIGKTKMSIQVYSVTSWYSAFYLIIGMNLNRRE